LSRLARPAPTKQAFLDSSAGRVLFGAAPTIADFYVARLRFSDLVIPRAFGMSKSREGKRVIPLRYSRKYDSPADHVPNHFDDVGEGFKPFSSSVIFG